MFVILWFRGDKGTRGVKKWICMSCFLLCANFKGSSLSIKCHWKRKERNDLLMNKMIPITTRLLGLCIVRFSQLFRTQTVWSHSRTGAKIHRAWVFMPDVPWSMLVSAARFHILLCLWLDHSKISNILKTIRIWEEILIELVTKVQTNSFIIPSS